MICPNCQNQMTQGHQCSVCAYYSAEDAELCTDCGVYKPKGIKCRSPKCFEDYRQKKNEVFAKHYGKMETVPGCAGQGCTIPPQSQSPLPPRSPA